MIMLMYITNMCPYILVDFSLALLSVLSSISPSPSYFTNPHLPILHSHSQFHTPFCQPVPSLSSQTSLSIFAFLTYISAPPTAPSFFPPYKHTRLSTTKPKCSVLLHGSLTILCHIAFHSLSFGKVVWRLRPLQSSIDNGHPLLIKLLCLHSLPLLYDRKMKCQQKVRQLFSHRSLFFCHFN